MNKQNLLLLSSTSVELIQKCTKLLFPLAKGVEKRKVAQQRRVTAAARPSIH
jgi:hypothetical protein